MNRKERVTETQELTHNYFKTAALLNLTYDEVRNICEGDEE